MVEIGPLREADDVSIAPPVDSSHALLSTGARAPGSYVMSSGAMLPFASTAKVSLQAGGEKVPVWCAPEEKVYVGEIRAIRLTNCYYLPKFGALIDASGRVSKTSFEEARFVVGDLTNLPNVRVSGSGAFLEIPADAKTIDDAVVFMPWGAMSNYGHFILDALPSLVLLSRLSPSRQWNVVSPPMSAWQRNLYDLVSKELGSLTLTIVDSDVVSLRSVLFFSTMNHFLHHGGKVWDDLRTALLAGASSRCLTPKRIFIVRDDVKRTFVNQSEIAEKLSELDFAPVAPERLSVEQQRELFSQAEIVVGVSGAGLANIIFCRPETRVVEIQPSLGQGIWVRNACVHLDLGWAPFFVESVPPAVIPIVGGSARPEIGISFRVPVEPLLAHIHQVIETMGLSSEK
ncbi:glycosyltransferase 61 family protein [Mesorhizobium sp. M1338]|uniref:glycosyltransferase family 61 protein n=1 Tax=Mesorhizobium sp. M1338 TaxID=2957085 RepID=UPI0033354015